MSVDAQNRTQRLAKREVRRAASARLGFEDGWGQPSLPTLGQALGFVRGCTSSPEGAKCDSPGRQPRVRRSKDDQALKGRHDGAIDSRCRGSVMECGSPCRFRCGTAGTKAVRSTALQDAGAESWQSRTLTSAGLETEY